MSTKNSRAVRDLAALQKTASTSRVLNLLGIRNHHRDDPDYATKPFFLNPTLNESLVVKHKVRPDELYVFKCNKPGATKIIIPFEKTDLNLGGRSLFVGQTGWLDMLQYFARDGQDFSRDILLLENLDELPSLDPFILREHLRRRGFDIASCYFGISEADMSRMQNYVGGQIQQLIAMAFPSGFSSGTEKLAIALLANNIDEVLEPLRHVMRLDPDTFREGLFSWKGFLYYKWSLSDMIPKLASVIKDLPNIQPAGRGSFDQLRYIEQARGRIVKAIRKKSAEITGSLKVYDDAYRELTENSKPLAFRDFLMNAPSMFLVLGEGIGVVAHIASFWRYRFPNPGDLQASADEIADILQDFEASLSTTEASVWGKE